MTTHKAVLLDPPIASLPWDAKRGSASMVLFILTEAMLFVSLFFGYFYLGAWNDRWPLDELPKLKLATVMLALLIASSVVLYFGEEASKKGRSGRARLLLAATIAMGLVFMVLQVFETKDHLRTLLPTTDAYGSIFYTITSLHALHLLLGLAMLGYTLLLPDLEGRVRPPHRPYHNAALYWHFVDVIWVWVVLLLYYLPHLQGA
jgi:heme/copper-type cytochrome/quinol oxidase subunit 3